MHIYFLFLLIQLASPSAPCKNVTAATYEYQLFAIGGSTSAGASNTVEYYNEQLAEWIQLEPLLEAKSNCGTTVLYTII